ncbi:TPA: mechanosensitive ion channel family protein [Proteus mirabilis]|uniref:mechanosensitive ion channel family protein n=1 Tax=Proteus mirabilis TaxID=584 RepID=UPI0018C5083D|nr:mechanosensitive ion channel family protein [Proteus mirabilis]HDT0721096.1 mechanosensitive ion channel family protein [Proteus mirabilis]HEJ9438644.1 mechanosensitive ion channel family protein [Proteus mirabilis]HEJ9661792.1 mechanosensitive ion channel family protein [Proteus mirabilis]HEK1718772.1 mechanosensitive ion channel family protein [Proteus mirabilis]
MNEELIMKYSIGIGIALACFIAFLAISFLHDKQKKRRRNIIIHIIQAILLCCLVVIVSQYCEMAVVDFKLHFISFQMINFFSYVAIALILMRKFFLLINLLEKAQIKKGSDPTSARIISRIFKITLFVIMILLFGEHFGMSLSGLMTFGGLGGIAIGMASKDVMSNLFSGVMLYFDRPFNIGDWVRSPDRNIEGTVVEIGWRITKIMTFDHRPLYIPNSVFSSISVENPGRMTNRRIETELGLRYEDSDKVGAIVADIRTMLQQHDKIDTKQTLLVYFNQFADSSLNIMVYCFTKTTVWAEWLDAQQEVYLKMIDIVHQHGADFAFPSQTVYIEKSSPVSP